MQNIIVHAVADPANHTVRLGWQDGSVSLVDFKPIVGRGVFAAFNDPAFFATVEVADGGHALAWPGELEFDADALWFEVHPEDAPATAKAHAASLLA